MLIPILLAVLVLLTLVAAFLGSKYWHWAHVLVVVLLFFSTVGFSFLAAEAYRVRTKFMRQELQARQQLEPLQELNGALLRGTNDQGIIARLKAEEVLVKERAIDNQGEETEVWSVVDLRHQLSLATRRLGRVWRNAQTLGAADPRTGQVSVQIETPSPLGIEEGAVLFVFEQGVANTQNPDQGPQYLAEFRVTVVNGQELTLEPVLTLDPREAARLNRSQAAWSLYETMPGDRHDLFADFTDNELRQLIPPGSVEAYLRDGTPWTVDDGEDTKEGRDQDDQIVGSDDWDDTTRFLYRRKLRDYAYLFNNLAKARINMIAKAQALQGDNEKLAATLARAEKITQYRTEEQGKLKGDLSGVQGDLQAIEQHLASLESQVGSGEQLLERTIAANSALVAQLTSLQQEKAGGIDLKSVPTRSLPGLDRDAL